MSFDYIGKVCPRHPELEGLRHRYNDYFCRTGSIPVKKTGRTRCKGCVKDAFVAYRTGGDDLAAAEYRASIRRDYRREYANRPGVKKRRAAKDVKRAKARKLQLAAARDPVV